MTILKDVLYDPDPDGQGGSTGSDGGNAADGTVVESVVFEEVVVVGETESTDQ